MRCCTPRALAVSSELILISHTHANAHSWKWLTNGNNDFVASTPSQNSRIPLADCFILYVRFFHFRVFPFPAASVVKHNNRFDNWFNCAHRCPSRALWTERNRFYVLNFVVRRWHIRMESVKNQTSFFHFFNFYFFFRFTFCVHMATAVALPETFNILWPHPLALARKTRREKWNETFPLSRRMMHEKVNVKRTARTRACFHCSPRTLAAFLLHLVPRILCRAGSRSCVLSIRFTLHSVGFVENVSKFKGIQIVTLNDCQTRKWICFRGNCKFSYEISRCELSVVARHRHQPTNNHHHHRRRPTTRQIWVAY